MGDGEGWGGSARAGAGRRGGYSVRCGGNPFPGGAAFPSAAGLSPGGFAGREGKSLSGRFIFGFAPAPDIGSSSAYL